MRVGQSLLLFIPFANCFCLTDIPPFCRCRSWSTVSSAGIYMFPFRYFGKCCGCLGRMQLERCLRNQKDQRKQHWLFWAFSQWMKSALWNLRSRSARSACLSILSFLSTESPQPCSTARNVRTKFVQPSKALTSVAATKVCMISPASNLWSLSEVYFNPEYSFPSHMT